MNSTSSFLQGLHDIQSTRYAQLSASVIIFFDHAITFGDEIDLIWKSNWTLGKILFLLNRYYSLAAIIFNNYALLVPVVDNSLAAPVLSCTNILMFTYDSCRSFFDWQGWTGLVSCILAEAILQMRLYAMYSLNKKILGLMVTSWIACLATSAYIMYTVLSHVEANAIVIPGGMFCVPSGVSSHFYAFWIPMLAFESLLCFLAIVRGFQTFRSRGSLFHSSRHLVGILIRDSILYFLVICAAYLTCLLIWILASVNLLGVPIGFSVALSCVLSNRVVLNVRAMSRDILAGKHTTGPISQIEDYAHDPSPSDSNAASSNFAASLTNFEMEKLRTMKARSNFSDIVDIEPVESPSPFIIL